MAAVLGFGVPVSGLAQIERLVMPGPVVAAHAEYENDCKACHVPFARGLQRDLCLDCHEDIAADINGKAGYHGLSSDIPNQECAECHTDHEGRQKDILGLNVAAFDHDLTDFPLLGSHSEAACNDCHASDALFREAPQACFSCHEEDDQHKGNLGEDCGDCHEETQWEDAKYDHDQTDFSLTGAHVDTACADCHVDEVYLDTPQQCIACHRDDDEHKGGNGEDCNSCHKTTDWADVSFDHFLATGFPLTRAHGELVCEDCHQGNKYEQSNSAECISCHQDDDAHDGVNGRVCNDCHQPTEWLDTTFDHGRDAGFILRGAHLENTCGDCHQVAVAVAKPETTCFGCHAEDEPHQVQLGEQCADCHNEVAWTNKVRFDHALTPFPLLGQHVDAVCEDCHASKAFHDASRECVECHGEDDAHNRHLGTDCGRCHNPSDWLLWVFDHDAETRFVLDGGHAGLDCLSCHRAPAASHAIGVAMSCGSCHRGDDVHLGAFGSDCAECHTTSAFAELKGL